MKLPQLIQTLAKIQSHNPELDINEVEFSVTIDVPSPQSGYYNNGREEGILKNGLKEGLWKLHETHAGAGMRKVIIENEEMMRRDIRHGRIYINFDDRFFTKAYNFNDRLYGENIQTTNLREKFIKLKNSLTASS